MLFIPFDFLEFEIGGIFWKNGETIEWRFCVCVEKFKSCEKAVKVFIKSIIILNPKQLRELKTESRLYLHIEIIIRYQ